MSGISDGELNDYLDGECGAEEARRIEEALAGDAGARARLDGLARVRSGLAALPRDGRAPSGIWDAIETRIGAEGPVVADRSGAAPGFWIRQRRTLLAASVVLLTAAGSYWLGRRSGSDLPVDATRVAESVEGTPPGPTLHLTSDVVRTFETASAELELVLREGAEVLEPETVRTLEESLATIDAAIAEAREALERDPGSLIVERRLVRVLQLKLDVLKQAVTALQRAA